MSLLSQLRPEDYRFKRQIEAILYRYLEKQNRLPNTEQKINTSAECKKRFIFEEIERMDERDIDNIYAFMLGRLGKAYLANGEVK